MSPPSSPYRASAPPPPSSDPDALDDRPVLWFLVCVGALRTVSVLLRGEAWDAGAVVLAAQMGVAGRALWRRRAGRRGA